MPHELTHEQRTPTPQIDAIWDRRERLRVWLDLWVQHLRGQLVLRPDLPVPDGALEACERLRETLRWDTNAQAVLHMADRLEQTVGHDLVAALAELGRWAGPGGADALHLGLTSHDIVDPTNQALIVRSMRRVLVHVGQVARALVVQAALHRGRHLVARTHGRPAQLTTYGHRVATVLGPLLDWHDRATWELAAYPMRPPHGAVGTAADLLRVLEGPGSGYERGPGSGYERGSTGPLGATGSASDASAGTSIPPGPPEATEGLSDGSRCLNVAPPQRQQCLLREGHVPSSVTKDGHIYPSQVGDRESPVVLRDGSTWTGLDEVRSTSVDLPPDPPRAPLSTSPEDPPRPPIETCAPGLAEAVPSGQWRSRRVSEIYTDHLLSWSDQSTAMDVTRQVYHRSYDLVIAGLVAQLASIAQTWATDRRLEAVLGLGNEGDSSGDPQRVGSSAMAHKRNPVLAERICSLAVIARGDQSVMAELAGMEWLEGDVSGSAARRVVLPRMFQNIDALLLNWLSAIDRWRPDVEAMRREVDIHIQEISSGALLQAAIEAGQPRSEAIQSLRRAAQQAGGWGRRSDTLCPFRAALVADPRFPLSADDVRRVIDEVRVGPVGNVDEQIDKLVERADLTVNPPIDWGQ